MNLVLRVELDGVQCCNGSSGVFGGGMMGCSSGQCL